MASDAFKELGVTPIKVASGRGVKPHVSLAFNDVDGKERLFSVDTTCFSKKMLQPDCYLITHAHSDHYGKSAMKSNLSVASTETAEALEILHEHEFNGLSFGVGEQFYAGGTEVSTFHTGHTIGSTAYYWENENGVRILVTGDVKDYSSLPCCDVLVTEANYGNPHDSTCYFEDDVNRFIEATDRGNVVFGAYAFGKAQRAVSLLRNSGFDDAIGMSSRGLRLTQSLLPDAGELVGINDGADVCIVTPRELSTTNNMLHRFVLTSSNYYYYPAIQISDHTDVRGLLGMVAHCQTKTALIYHPKGDNPKIFSNYLNEKVCNAIALEDIAPTCQTHPY